MSTREKVAAFDAGYPASLARDDEIVISSASRTLFPSFRELLRYRELLMIMTVRDIKVRYKQTVLGILWAAINPVMTMVVFTFVFGRLAKVPSNGIPYELFSFAALLPWQFFMKALMQGSMSLVMMRGILTKVYFPRLYAPISVTISGLVDFCIAFILLVALMIWFGFGLRWQMIFLPLLLLLSIVSALSVAFWLAGINVRYRDVQFALPFVGQLWMFLTPVAYPSHLVPGSLQFLYMLNPMAGVVEGFRWSLLGGDVEPNVIGLGVSCLVTIILFVTGLVRFTKAERVFADVV